MKPGRRGLAKAGFHQTQPFALKALGRGEITARQIEAARIAINRSNQRSGRLFIECFPHLPVTKKPLEVRMGKGKGGVNYWSANVRPGQILFQLQNVTHEQAKAAFSKAEAKLNIRCKLSTLKEVVN